MKTVTKTYTVYQYQELCTAAKDKVKQWYLDDVFRPSMFEDYVIEDLTYNYNFKNSDFRVCFSLGYCQGDGLNIEGRLYLSDFINAWTATEKEKRTMQKYIEHSLKYYTFEKNNHYSYSCKFIDKKYILSAVEEFIDGLSYFHFKNINTGVIEKFYNDMIDFFEKLDSDYEDEGYKFFYEITEEDIVDACDVNDWYFNENGILWEA